MLTWCEDVHAAFMVSVKHVVQRIDIIGVADVGGLNRRNNVDRRGRHSDERAGKEGKGGEMHCV